MSDDTFAQACLTGRLGGLGLRRVAEHADLAFAASWHESKRTSKEQWTAPPGLSPVYKSQKEASFEFDQTMHEFLVSQADERAQQRLRPVAQPHACGFLTAVPSDEDGKDTLLRPRLFRTAVAYRLGIALVNEEIPCPLCQQPINIFGDHAVCCTNQADTSLFATTHCAI